jgi:hypothetical protein
MSDQIEQERGELRAESRTSGDPSVLTSKQRHGSVGEEQQGKESGFMYLDHSGSTRTYLENATSAGTTVMGPGRLWFLALAAHFYESIGVAANIPAVTTTHDID